MGTITGASAVYMLQIPGLFPTPVQIQGFAADDVFSTDPIDNVQVKMGVDGIMSAGFVFVEVKQKIMLQADSVSNAVFDLLYAQMQQSTEAIFMQGIVNLKTIGTSWTMNNGVLTSYPPLPDAKAVLQSRVYGITWNSVSPAVAS